MIRSGRTVVWTRTECASCSGPRSAARSVPVTRAMIAAGAIAVSGIALAGTIVAAGAIAVSGIALSRAIVAAGTVAVSGIALSAGVASGTICPSRICSNSRVIVPHYIVAWPQISFGMTVGASTGNPT